MPTPSSKLTVYHDTWSGKPQQLINLSDLAVSLGEDYCATLLGVYVFRGEDCTSAFIGKGEVGPLSKKLAKNPRFNKAFMQATRWGIEPKVSRAEAVGRVYLPDVRTEPRVFDGRPPCQTPAQDRGWGNSLPNLRSTWLAFLSATLLWSHLHHRVALYKRADETILEKSKPYYDG